jgi:hypothetical protein
MLGCLFGSGIGSIIFRDADVSVTGRLEERAMTVSWHLPEFRWNIPEPELGSFLVNPVPNALAGAHVIYA